MLARASMLAAIALLALTAAGAHAAQPPIGWNGENPFVCELQLAGFEATGPNPAADPYCVEFDKRRQNVTQLGVVEFMSKEPARVAAASDKCFYFQSDHWRGSIVQDDGTTKTYEWDGHYFFDKARAEGGVWVTNFNFNGRTQDPGSIPGMPPEYGRYFGPGTGGFITRNEVQGEARCVEKARLSSPYRPLRPGARGCLGTRGSAGPRAIGGVALGDPESRVRSRLGAPFLVKRGFLRWCFQDGTSIRVGQAADRSGELGEGGDDPTIALLTTSPAYRVRGIGPGSTLRALRRAWPGARPAVSAGGGKVWRLARRGRMLAGVRRGRVIFLATHDPDSARRRADLAELVRRAG